MANRRGNKPSGTPLRDDQITKAAGRTQDSKPETKPERPRAVVDLRHKNQLSGRAALSNTTEIKIALNRKIAVLSARKTARRMRRARPSYCHLDHKGRCPPVVLLLN